MSNEYAVGQVWTWPIPEGFEDSRIIIGAVETLEDGEEVICIAATAAPVPRREGKVARMTIPFLPFSKKAMDTTVLELDGNEGELPEDFHLALQHWKMDPANRIFFQEPFPTLLSTLHYALQDDDSPLNEKA